jgi:protein phosphatase
MNFEHGTLADIFDRADRPVSESFTHVGGREQNQDSLLADDSARLYVVCDGMGGAPAGDVASTIAVKAVRESYVLFRGMKLSVKDSLEHALMAANAAVWGDAKEHPERAHMGTTAVALVVHRGKVTIAHVGDSRCYMLRAGALRCQTEDHRGQFQAPEGLRTCLTRAIGEGPSIRVTCREIATKPGDVFLLCSDGVWESLEPQEIAIYMDVREAADHLLQACLRASAQDNVSGIVVRVKG